MRNLNLTASLISYYKSTEVQCLEIIQSVKSADLRAELSLPLPIIQNSLSNFLFWMRGNDIIRFQQTARQQGSKKVILFEQVPLEEELYYRGILNFPIFGLRTFSEVTFTTLPDIMPKRPSLSPLFPTVIGTESEKAKSKVEARRSPSMRFVSCRYTRIRSLLRITAAWGCPRSRECGVGPTLTQSGARLSKGICAAIHNT